MDIVYKPIDGLIEKALGACQAEVFMYARHKEDEWSEDQAAKYRAVLRALKAAQEIGRILFV